MAASLVLVKSFTYRGAAEEFSNRYHFDGTPALTDAEWLALDLAVRAQEKTVFPSHVSIIRSIGYLSDTGPADWTRSATLAGTGSFGGERAPGDCAGWIRWETGERDSRGHPVYLRNYYHGVMMASGTDPDNIYSDQRAAYDAYGGAWVTGFSDGTTTRHRCSPSGTPATGHHWSLQVGRRLLKRRG